MSADGSISLIWGDGEHVFRLAIGQFRELQEKVNGRRLALGGQMVGPMSLLNQLRANDAWPDDIRDVLRLGLIGGGMKPPEAHRMLVSYFDANPHWAYDLFVRLLFYFFKIYLLFGSMTCQIFQVACFLF